MKILLCGYGTMGQEVETILLQRGHQLTASVDPSKKGTHPRLSDEVLHASDVVIEFSHADTGYINAAHYLRTKTPAVIGTTGIKDTDWFSRLQTGDIACLVSENFSVGAYLFRLLCKAAAEWTNVFLEYDMLLYELHHHRKKDSPSGTALAAAKTILEHSTRKKKIYHSELPRPILPEELHISSVRGGEIPGTHTLMLDSAADSIEITHRARSRAGFALGAVQAAEWIVHQSAGLYTTEDYMQDIIQKGHTQDA